MYQKKILLSMICMTLFLWGCFGGSDNDAGPVVPSEYITLNGVLTAPEKLESTLLADIRDNTDSDVRSAYQNAVVSVNGAPNSVYSLTPLSSTPNWQFRIPSVGKTADGRYLVDVRVGRINLKAMVYENEIANFRINSETTATWLLAQATNRTPKELIASFPSFVSSVERSFLDMCKIEAGQHPGQIVNSATLTAVLKDQTDIFSAIDTITTSGKLAYLKETNDLDGDGINDVLVETNIDNTRISFKTMLSDQTSILPEINSLSAYSNERLLQDFKENLTSSVRLFSADAKNFALGLYFKKSAVADVYLKLFVHRIDLANGVFKGAVVEYEFVNTETTAILTGSKILLLQGASPVDGAVAATNFVTDSDPGPYVLSFISTSAGIGCNSGDTRLVKAKEIPAELSQYRTAETYLDGGGNYHVDTTSALKEWNLNRGIEVGDVFSAYFPNIKNYALFKITNITATTVTLDFIVNIAENEPRFK